MVGHHPVLVYLTAMITFTAKLTRKGKEGRMRDRAIVRRSKMAIVRERHLFGVLPSFSIYIIAYFSQKIKFFSAHSHAGSTSHRCTERGEEGAPFSIRRSSRWRRMRSRDLALTISGLIITAGLQPITCARSRLS